MRALLPLAVAISACASSSSQVDLFPEPSHPRTKPDTVVALLSSPPADSVLAARGEFSIIVSAHSAVRHLEEKLTRIRISAPTARCSAASNREWHRKDGYGLLVRMTRRGNARTFCSRPCLNRAPPL